MNNKLRTLMAFSALSLSLAAMPAFGGELETLRVTVPFAFTAGKTNLPAGDYTVYESDAHLLTIRGEKGSVLILGTPAGRLVLPAVKAKGTVTRRVSSSPPNAGTAARDRLRAENAVSVRSLLVIVFPFKDGSELPPRQISRGGLLLPP